MAGNNLIDNSLTYMSLQISSIQIINLQKQLEHEDLTRLKVSEKMGPSTSNNLLFSLIKTKSFDWFELITGGGITRRLLS